MGDELDTIPFGVSIDLRKHKYMLDRLYLLLPMPLDYPEPNHSYTEHSDMQALIQWIHQYNGCSWFFISYIFYQIEWVVCVKVKKVEKDVHVKIRFNSMETYMNLNHMIILHIN